ncbi:hypothetical protein R5R35_008824 [Gryllus longicercus]|uniref:Uncharacterized protein n=1 Tax=Gryllus longicercus TaxID=2509291 RepID=A0AAN9YXK1_9ORTH
MSSNQPTLPFNTTPLSRKRPHSPDFPNEEGAGSDIDHSCERNNCHITFVLDSESPLPTDENSESVCSVQQAGTVSAKDTSDTSWSSDELVSTDVEFEEYDVTSIPSPEKLWSNCDSSGSDDMLYTATAATVSMPAHLREDRDSWADSSSSNLDSSDSDVTVPMWPCVRCKIKSIPQARYCVKCFQLRKGYFPERPKRTHRRRRKRATSSPPDAALADMPSNVLDLEQAQSSGNQSAGKLEKGDNGISLGVNDKRLAPECASSSQSSSLMLQMGSQDSAPPEDADRELLSPKSELCTMCFNKPKDGAFVHSKTVHIMYCYQCALKVWNETKKCAMCERRPHDVLKFVFG